MTEFLPEGYTQNANGVVIAPAPIKPELPEDGEKNSATGDNVAITLVATVVLIFGLAGIAIVAKK